ncbi:hypothetical protein COW36_12615 [bacterium (Candidatus Blackallbacteria) CG17_big_fil_post_rev_8_21_14_2_50_48_46]|uniref:Peptidase metallopeptidase domain-containing protein n=1 Tax=bacterium (Candidatus Blackallbacteria) CG17_big_fil_post_rev_8_21_14_2_50_48_46 TaxID=2014261 RepID=A0A2M7G4Z3_9BACT|nr:MAG: hypothetical protein COW64_02645 [bacterium (Candidatus Blackallbacteria) CG18_big_fil_WC_8_21_14_2_50_49_26]PIW16604.1 MAG: hypothetical protein COW36_12615 [bacterium (Candidatus Blackallbacteria) CG17_big_fil_post_rev_8_21_14_2_50_48_46]PIW46112.1 MAG: hypothetical protein COW20_17880 [bacterium (Candidatus Blackallbacteria) CG13_big_fil_rev_8_21_14_2_50_49_14]
MSTVLKPLLLSFFLLWFPLPLQALVADYLCAENHETDFFLKHRWSPKEFPLRVYLPYPDASISLADREMPVRAVMKALESWHQAWPYIRFQFVDSPQKASIQVVWFEQLFRDNQGRWGEAFFPEPYRTPKGKLRHWSKLHLALFTHPGSAQFSSEPVALNFQEIRDLAIHEMGHALGLIHSNDGNDVMGGGNLFLATVLDQRNISARDIATLKRLYSLPAKSKKQICAPSK